METQDIYNNNEFNELDDLRQQINDLKSKVDQQGHLNEDLVKETIKGKMNDVHRTLTKLGIVALATIPLIIFNKYYIGLSWPLTIVTIVLLVAFLISDGELVNAQFLCAFFFILFIFFILFVSVFIFIFEFFFCRSVGVDYLSVQADISSKESGNEEYH